jgi:hypothetical protein
MSWCLKKPFGQCGGCPACCTYWQKKTAILKGNFKFGENAMRVYNFAVRDFLTADENNGAGQSAHFGSQQSPLIMVGFLASKWLRKWARYKSPLKVPTACALK